MSNRFSCGICKLSFPSPQILGRHLALPHGFHRRFPRRPVSEAAALPQIGNWNFESTAQSGPRDMPSGAGAPGAQHSASMESPNGVTVPEDGGDFTRDEPNIGNQPHVMSIGTLVHTQNDHVQQPFLGNADVSVQHNLEPGSSVRSAMHTLIYEFYEGFKDEHTLLWKNLAKPVPILRQSEALVEHCMCNRLQGSEIAALYELLVNLEELRGAAEDSWILEDFPNVSVLQNRVVQERRWAVKSQGWREAIIKNRFGKKERGVFIPIRHLVAQIVEDYGGLDNLVRYCEETDDGGNRIFSSPVNSDAMKLDTEAVLDTGENVVYFSLYCDKTMLARCGSADGFAVRLRVDNLKGANNVWFEVGYAPILSATSDASAMELSNARLELFQRFLFMVLRDITQPDYYTQDREYPKHLHSITLRLLSFPSDQPQERENLCLMRGQSNQDCSRCTFRSLEERNFNKRRRPEEPQGRGTKRRKNSSVVRRELSAATSGIMEGGLRPPMLPIPPLHGRVTFDNFQTRDVSSTPSQQLKAARLDRELRVIGEEVVISSESRRERRKLSGELSNVKRNLAQQSALPLPPALAVIDGIGSAPLRLYDTVVIDVLHTFDLGISRQFCDDAYTVFGRASYATTRSKASLVKAANKRIRLLPAESECRTYVPFRSKETEKQASFTGKQRRQLCPFLWIAVIGLNEKVPPDEDKLFITALNLDYIQAELKGINRHPSECRRTRSSIERLQQRVQVACDLFQEVFVTNENTKLHRLRVHLAEQLVRFGNVVMSDTGPNETLHRGLKQSYAATNKRPEFINRQLLQVNIAADVNKNRCAEEVVDNLLLTRTKRVSIGSGERGASSIENTVLNGPSFQEKLVADELSDVLCEYRERTGLLTPQAAFETIRSKRDLFNCYLFSERKHVDIEAHLEWCEGNVRVKQRMYAGKGFKNWGGDRFDAVRFTYKEFGVEKFAYGIVRGLFSRNSTVENNFAGVRVALVCLLQTVAPEAGNTKIVREYGFERLEFALYEGDVRLLCVPVSNVQRKAVIVRDSWDGTKRFGFDVPLETLPTRKEHRKLAKFFIVKNYQFTAVAETQL